MKRILVTGTTALAWASTVVLLAASPAAADDAPTGGVTSNSPVQGDMVLIVDARDDVKLASTAAFVDGVQVASASLCPADPGSDCTVQRAKLTVDTTPYADGIHHRVVTVTDAAGNVATFVNEDFEVWNHRPPSWSPTATLHIGSSPTGEQGSPPGSGPGGGVKGASNSSCSSPKLSMFLAQKPLRVSKGVPVLLKGKRYRFTGRLTCVINGKRKSAPIRTKVDLFNVVKGKTVRKPGTTVKAGGTLTLTLSYTSARTIEFRYRAADGKTTKVRIKVRIAQRKKG